MPFKHRWLIAALTLISLFALISAHAEADSPLEQTIADAWQLAQDSGSYSYRTLVEQTTYPLPTIRNAGARPKVQVVGMEGSADRSNQSLTLTLWQNASFNPDTGIGIRVENEQTLARRGQDEWVEIGSVTEMFAPGGDPLGFLASVENVTEGERRTIELGGTTIESTQYLFEIDGEAFAAHARAEMEAQLQRQGKLPMGMRLSASEAYRQMTGNGELWIGRNGLPQRLVLEINIPAHADQERVTAVIENDYFGYDTARLNWLNTPFAQAPHIWLAANAPTEQIGNGLALAIVIGVLGYLMVAYWQTRRLYRVVVSLMIGSMVFAPLLRAVDAHAFFSEQEAQKAEYETRKAEAQQWDNVRADQATTDWQPNVPATTQLQADLADPFTIHHAPFTISNSSGVDTDGDGLTDDDEINLWGTDPNNTDSDGDGLSDGVEAYEIGTAPALPDTDSDQISDGLEVQGFSYNGQQWYTDPLDVDSNRDNLPDGMECAVRVVDNPSYDPNGVCPDTDGDGTPDLFDDDNDGDGVVDRFDVSPLSVGTETYSFDNQLEVTIDNLEVGQPVYLDLQLRPTNPDHLNYVQSVFDWPTGDHEGQVTRYLDSTWADTSNVALQSSAENAANGDLRIIPMLELHIPFNTTGHYGNLPVNDTYSGGDRPGGSINNWIDQSRLDPYGVTVSDAGVPNLVFPDILAYIPVSVIDNPDTGETVALGARMPYFPEQGTGGMVDWGDAHSYNLVWMVQMLTDQCVDPTADPDTCAREDVVQVIHAYDDEWTLTGMRVSEEQGMDVAIVYEDPANDPDLNVDDQLWAASWGLNATFVRGRDADLNGVRDVRLDNLATEIDGWHDPAAGDFYLNVQPLGGFNHSDEIMTVMMTETVALLDSAFAGYESQTVPSFLFAKEVTNREVGLELMTVAGNGISADFADITPITTASLTWKPYQYVAGEWTNADPEAYLETLAHQFSQSVFIAQEDDDPDYIDEIEGRIVWAQLYYSALYQGISNIVATDGAAMIVPSADYSIPEATYDPTWPAATFTGAAYVGTAFFQAALAGLATTIRNVGAQPGASQGTFYSSFKSTLGDSRSKTFANNFANSDSSSLMFRLGVDMLLMFVAVIAITASVVLLYGLIAGKEQVVNFALVVLNVTTIIVSLVHLMVIINALHTLWTTTATGLAFLTLASRIQTFLNNSNAVGAAGLVVGLLVTWGIFLYQLLGPGFDGNKIAKNVALSLAIAASMIILVQAILYIVISVASAATAGILSILFLLFIIVEAILFLSGEKTITERATEALAKLLYDVDFILANFNSADRLKFDIADIDLVDPNLGISVDNSFRATIAVTNTINFRKSASNNQAKYAAFEYHAQTGDVDQHSTLKGNSIREQWVTLPGRALQYTTTVTSDAYQFATAGTGLNRPIADFYLTEAYALPYRGCWLGVTGCNREYVFGSLHIDVGEELLFDIFPATLAEFVDFETWTDGAITNTVTFDVQRDWDNDGLIVDQLGGADPNDSDSDSDNDTVSDHVELINGTNPLDPDTDDDGLTDGEEIIHLTDPLDPDTDDDGLNDAIEVKTGWLVPYGVNSATMRVWSSPFSADADNDRLTDYQEFLFGMHPSVPNDASAIANIVQFDEMRVNEVDLPLLHLQFEENSLASLFKDAAGNDDFFCAANCPTAGVTGRYGSGVEFGAPLTHNDAIIDPAAPFSIGAWVKSTSGSGAIFTHSNTTNGDGVLELDGNRLRYSHTQGVLATGNSFLNDGVWHHVMLTWDGANPRLYVDGVDDTGAASFVGISADSGASTTQIGAVDLGTLDEVIVYDRVLSMSEIADVMHGRHNPDDLIVRPSDVLSYQVTVTNTLFTQDLDGYLIGATEYISPAVTAPALLLEFEQSDRRITFPNDVTGEDSGIGCIGDGSNCPTFDVAGVYGNAVEFDGDYLELPSVHQGLASGSVAFWIRPNSFPTTSSTILTTDSDDIGALDITLDSDGHLNFDIYGRDSVTAHRTADPLTPNTWQHVIWHHYTNDEAGSVSSAIIIDGGIPTTQNHAYPVAPHTLAIGPGRLGNSMAGDAPFDGAIDELAFYNDQILWSVGDIDRAAAVRNGNYYPGLDTDDYVSWPAYLLEFETDRQGAFRNTISDAYAATCTSEARCPMVVVGQYGDSADFDGTNDQLFTPNAVNPGEDEFTAMAWINPDTLGGVFLAQQQGSGVGRQWLGIFNTGELYTRVHSASAYNSGHVLTAGSWQHVALTSDGTTIKLYVDGVLVNQFDATPQANDGGMVVGNSSVGSVYFDGQIDDLAIIPAALDVTAIRSVMNNRYPAIEIADPLVDFHIGATVETDYLAALARHDDARYITTLMTVSADTCTTCPTIVTQSGSGNSLTFDGVDDWIDVGTSPNLADTYSFGFWFKAEQPTSNQTILALTDDNGNYLPGVLVELTSAGTLRYVDRPQVGGSGGTELASSGNIADGEWHHVVVTRVFVEFGFPDSEYEMRLYVDGALEGAATTLGDINEEPLALSIGRFRPATPRYFDGELDELIVYADDLTESEVQLLLERNAPAGDQNVISSTAHVSARAGTGLHRFEETVEAALQPQTPIDYPIVDDQGGDLQLFVPFEDVPASERFQNMISTGDMTCQSPACPSAGVRGIADRAALFDGRDDRISGATFTADDATLAAWVKAESGTLIDMRRVLEGFQPPNTPAVDSGTGMWLDMTGLHWFMRDASNGDAKIRYDLPLNLPLGEWAHVAAVFDTSTGVVTAYVDGVEVGSETTAMAAGDAWTGDDPVLGATKFGSSVLDGYLDDVRIYDVALSSAEISTLIANSAPVLRFEFDETSDAPVFNDSSQNGAIGIPTANTAFNATLGETVTTLSPIAGTDGQIGNTALFDGNSAITLDDASPIDALTNDLTIMAWINPDDVTTVQNIIGHTTANSGDGFRFNIDENGQLRFTLTGKKHLVSTATVAPEAWQHVAVVFDSSNDAHFYLDGALVDTISNTSTMLPNSDDVMMIGGTTNSSNALLWPFAGQIDELAVYGRGMSSAEITSIYQRELRWYRARAVNEITIDTDAPTLQLVTDYGYRAAGYTQLVVAAGDATSRVALLDVGVRNLGQSEFVWQGASECDDSERAGVAWCPVLDLSEGVYELQFRAVDAVGYETTSAITQLIVDATAPTVGSGYSDSWLQATTTDDLTWQIALNGTISDPAISGSAGSGVVTESVLVSLVNGLGEALDGAARRASVTGGAWSVSYQVAGTVPDGLYSVVVSAEDVLGNQAETTVGTILLDERASSADVNRWQLPVGTIISDTLVLSGTVSESAEWGGELAVYHLEQTASPFYDSGLDQAHATCTNCPTSTTGVYGNALQFDGVDDSVTMPNPFNPITDLFSIALWFNAGGSGTRVLVQQQDGSGTGRALLFLNGSNVLQTNLGAGTGGNFGGTTMVSADSWHHVVLTYDGTVGRIYLDGQLDGEGTLTAESADGDLILGHNKANTARFVGALDEVTIYDHALSAYTVQALANTAANGVGTVRVGFQTVDFSVLTDTTNIRATALQTTTWVTATVDNVGANFSPWTASDDALREDFYTVLLESTDAEGNRSPVGTVWRGLIDRVPPQIVGSGLQDGGETAYTIVLTDFILDEGSADVPCDSAEWAVTRYDALLPHDGRASQIMMTCRVDGLESSRDVTVCDAAGNCTTETIQVTVPTVVTVRSADAQDSWSDGWVLLAVLLLLFMWVLEICDFVGEIKVVKEEPRNGKPELY